MCVLCAHVHVYRKANGGYLTDEQTEAALKNIGERMRDGDDQEHLQDLIDDVLGTKMPERDSEAEEAWEKANRKKDG